MVTEAVTEIPVPRLIDVEGLGELYQVPVAVGYHVIGPAVQDGAIVLRELSSAAGYKDLHDSALAPGVAAWGENAWAVNLSDLHFDPNPSLLSTESAAPSPPPWRLANCRRP